MKSAFQLEENRSDLVAREELEQLEMQLYRMQHNVKEIAKEAEVIGIDQTKHENWVIVYANKKAKDFQLMLHDCRCTYKGNWHSALQAAYKADNTLHIAAIKGEEDQGYGSVLMQHLKDVARQENMRYITGDLVERDYDHVDRLMYFYEKHSFDVTIDHDERCGEIVWNDW